MRRPTKPVPFDGYFARTFPLTWVECCSCYHEVRFEFAWHFVIGPYHNGIGVDIHLCRQCSPSKSNAMHFAKVYREQRIEQMKPPQGEKSVQPPKPIRPGWVDNEL